MYGSQKVKKRETKGENMHETWKSLQLGGRGRGSQHWWWELQQWLFTSKSAFPQLEAIQAIGAQILIFGGLINKGPYCPPLLPQAIVQAVPGTHALLPSSELKLTKIYHDLLTKAISEGSCMSSNRLQISKIVTSDRLSASRIFV